MKIKTITCIIKTTQYERYLKSPLWKKLPSEKKESLRQEHQHHTAFVAALQHYLRKEFRFKVTYSKSASRIPATTKKAAATDLIMTVGGDGTFLEAAQYAGKIPIVGVNSNYQPDPKHGSIGALTSIDSRNFRERLGRLQRGGFIMQKLPLLTVKVNGKIMPQHAVNEIFIGNKKSYKSTDITVAFGQQKERFNCSGIIIATPIGAQAWYSNAGGKPFAEDSFAFLLRETNQDRKPLFTSGVVSQKGRLLIYPNTEHQIISCDSRDDVIPLQPGDKVEVELGKRFLRRIVFEQKIF